MVLVGAAIVKIQAHFTMGTLHAGSSTNTEVVDPAFNARRMTISTGFAAMQVGECRRDPNSSIGKNLSTEGVQWYPHHHT